jgi:hypothetical protein
VSSIDTISILLHASSKIGKSTLTSTVPFPLCVLDAEGGWRFIKKRGFNGTPIRIKQWNPSLEEPPTYDGTWDVCHVTISTWQDILNAYVRLTQQPHQFRSIVLDSISELQRKCKSNLVGTEQMKIQDWGTLLNQMDSVIRGFRDLNLLPGSVQCVVFIAETKFTNDKWRPYMQGQIGTTMPYWVDICGYLYAEAEVDPADPNGQATINVRKLLVGPHPQIESGERVQGALPGIVRDPDITEMMKAIFGPECLEEAHV